MIKYLFLLIPFTIKAQDTAKYCFTAKQMDYWIGCSIDSKTYKQTTDSLFIVVDSLNADKRDLKDLNKSANSLIDSQKKVIKRKNLAVYLWQGISGAISCLFVYREFNR